MIPATTDAAAGERLGLVEWFRPGEEARVERVLRDVRALGVRSLRTGVSWADWHTAEGRAWTRWLVPRLAREVELLPCFTYTPPSRGIEPRTSSPPRRTRDYADFLDEMVGRFGDHFAWLELWNEPNNLNDWDWRMDPSWNLFAQMIGDAAHWMHRCGKRTVLGGMAPTDPNWLRLMAASGALAEIDAVGLHAFPGTWEFHGAGWDRCVGQVREALQPFGLEPQLWITEVGYSTWRFDEREQARVFLDAVDAPVERVYWYAACDLHDDLEHQEGFHQDERHYHFGLRTSAGAPKLLHRWWQRGGVGEVRRAVARTTPPTPAWRRRRPVVITGGAGFVGTNLAHRLLDAGESVLLVDNLGREGVESNLRWLRETHGERVQIDVADVRDRYVFRDVAAHACAVVHLAAQVAVTTSTGEPATDFDVNARGTLHLLESLRALREPPPLLFTSTNKVYGALAGLEVRADGARYEPADPGVAASGVGEEARLDFRSPYGCSKGSADQYVLDYARGYGLPAAVFRMSCIYGPHQFGTEDQGWVAHFLLRALAGEAITLYGDGRQVRDVLFVDDLVEAMLLALRGLREGAGDLSGRAFNIGGGPQRSVSLLELLDLIAELGGERPAVRFGPWRPGDQRYYVTDTRRFRAATGWEPRVSVREGVGLLRAWLLRSRGARVGVAGPRAVAAGARP